MMVVVGWLNGWLRGAQAGWFLLVGHLSLPYQKIQKYWIRWDLNSKPLVVGLGVLPLCYNSL